VRGAAILRWAAILRGSAPALAFHVARFAALDATVHTNLHTVPVTVHTACAAVTVHTVLRMSGLPARLLTQAERQNAPLRVIKHQTSIGQHKEGLRRLGLHMALPHAARVRGFGPDPPPRLVPEIANQPAAEWRQLRHV
jgi:hypothetical protein